MAMSGMPVSDDCLHAFEELKKKKCVRYIIFVVEKNKIIVEKKHELDQHSKGRWCEFVEEFKDDECKYGVYDLGILTKNGASTNKIVMCQW